jgi:hypothetical protein
MKGLRLLAPIAMLALFLWVGIGCSNPDNVNFPDVPNIGDDNGGDVLDPSIPPSYVLPNDAGDLFSGVQILDLAFEKDGDLVFAIASGLELFDPFAQHKRNIQSGIFDGLVDQGPGVNDFGRGVIATGPDLPNPCAWMSIYDDQFVTGGSPMADCPS